MKQIPPSRLRSCCHCGEQIDSNQNGNFQFASGWVKVRHAGGPHVTLPIYADKWACGNCIDRLQHGLAPGQLTIFDAINQP